MEKKRSSNFSTFETNLLIKLVEDKKHVLDPQKPNAMKHGAWREITTNFNNNVQIRTYRDEKALKKKYSNLKCDAKNWPTLRAEALSKLSNPESYEINYQLKREKPITSPIMTIKPKIETFDENGFGSYLEDMKPQLNEKIPSAMQQDTDTETSGEGEEETDSSSHQKRPLLLDKQSEDILKVLSEKRIKIIEKDAKRQMEILENEHQEQMKFLKFKHDMTMKRLGLEQERISLELDFLQTEVAFKNNVRKHVLMRERSSN